MAAGDDAIVGVFSEALAAFSGRVRLAVIDHVASFPPVVMPVEALASAAARAGALVLVDGAHALGSVHISLAPSGPLAANVHFYTANCHK